MNMQWQHDLWKAWNANRQCAEAHPTTNRDLLNGSNP